MENRKISVAITHGDTNGVGYELIFKTFAEPEMLELCTPIIYGSPKIAAYHRKALDIHERSPHGVALHPFDVLVSCPLSSENIHDDSFSFPGLTKYVETCVGDGAKAMEIMLSEEMRMAVEAAGTNIKDVAGKLSQEGIMASVKTLSASAHRDFGLSNASGVGMPRSTFTSSSKHGIRLTLPSCASLASLMMVKLACMSSALR